MARRAGPSKRYRTGGLDARTRAPIEPVDTSLGAATAGTNAPYGTRSGALTAPFTRNA